MVESNLTNITRGDMLSFDYTNHNGVRARRRVTFHCLVYGYHSQYYPTSRFLLKGYCDTKQAVRDFDIAKIENVTLD